jgi:hypothetical protein
MNKSGIIIVALCLTGCGGSSSGGSGGGNPATGGSITFTASGEVLALVGYDFPPAPMGGEFVDGWEVKFDQFIVTIDKIKLSENPDLDPGNESKTGALVGEVDGPWAVDLHKGGPLPGKGGMGEQAVEIASLDNQNKNGGGAFEAASRYAFGFDLVAASDAAKNVNLDADGQKAYEEMKQNGWVVLYDGTATFKGTKCAPSNPELDALPKQVHFHLGFASPTSYVNCQNPDNDPAKPLGDEEHERGIALKPNATTYAQVTVHSDHPFWESFVHDSPAHFDMLAAQHVGETKPTVLLDDVKGVDPTAITDNDGKPVDWRTCDPKNYTPPGKGQMSFDTLGIPVNPKGNPATSIRDLKDYMTYNQSTQGHLNSDGLCFVDRHYPSPP